jgi:hypothetical protein
MRRPITMAALATVVAALAVACVASEQTVGTAAHEHASPSDPSFSKLNDITRVDFEGKADLIVEEAATAQHWVVRDENLPAEFCSVQEGGVTPGMRRLLRFTVTTPNIGDADVFVGSPLAHADPNGDGVFTDNDGMFEFASCHAHFHFTNYAIYRLISAETGEVWRSAKKGFCMLDTDPNSASQYTGESPAGDRNFYSCGTLTRDGFQGVSHGWADTYIWFLAGQYFVLDGGDGQRAVPPGKYWIEVTVNPGIAPVGRKSCAFATDSKGLCHNFEESNYENNTMRTLVTIPDHPGRDGFGPLKGAKVYDTEQMKGS